MLKVYLYFQQFIFFPYQKFFSKTTQIYINYNIHQTMLMKIHIMLLKSDFDENNF